MSKKKKAAPKKAAKKRANKYEKKLVIKGTLDEVLRVSIPRKSA